MYVNVHNIELILQEWQIPWLLGGGGMGIKWAVVYLSLSQAGSSVIIIWSHRPAVGISVVLFVLYITTSWFIHQWKFDFLLWFALSFTRVVYILIHTDTTVRLWCRNCLCLNSFVRPDENIALNTRSALQQKKLILCVHFVAAVMSFLPLVVGLCSFLS